MVANFDKRARHLAAATSFMEQVGKLILLYEPISQLVIEQVLARFVLLFFEDTLVVG